MNEILPKKEKSEREREREEKVGVEAVEAEKETLRAYEILSLSSLLTSFSFFSHLLASVSSLLIVSLALDGPRRSGGQVYPDSDLSLSLT